MDKIKQEVKAKRKRTVKPKEDKQVMDGLGVSFEEAMKVLSQPKDNDENKK